MTLPHQPTDAEAELDQIFSDAEYDVEGALWDLPAVKAALLAWHKRTALAEFLELLPKKRGPTEVHGVLHVYAEDVGFDRAIDQLRQAAVKKYGEAE